MLGPVKLTGVVVGPGNPDYDDARQAYNSRLSFTPRDIVFCSSADDVAHAIVWARQNRVPIRARSGGHSYEGFSLVDDGLVVDVGEMASVSVDLATNRATVGAGIALGPLYQALWNQGVTISAGSCMTVGIAGLALGGGFGLLARNDGLTCDNLLAADMVTATGKLIHADAHTNADLYWALRGGGGGNFGFVTSFTFRVVPISNVAIFQIQWPWSQLQAVLQAWQAWAPGVDNRLSSVLKLKASLAGNVASIGQFVGSQAELTTLLAPLLSTGTPTSTSIQEVPFITAANMFGGEEDPGRIWTVHHHEPGSRFKNTSDYADTVFGDAAIDVIIAQLSAALGSDDLVQLDAYGGAVNAVAPDATAFVHRGSTKFCLQYQAYWMNAADDAARIAWVEGFRGAMQPYVTGEAYCNYCDIEIADWKTAYYGGNLARLIEVKKKVDPENVFRFPQSIPTM